MTKPQILDSTGAVTGIEPTGCRSVTLTQPSPARPYPIACVPRPTLIPDAKEKN